MPLPVSCHVSCRADDSDKHEMDVNKLLFHNGKLYSAADDGKIKVWSADLTLLGQVQAHPCSAFSLAASEDSLYSCSNEGTIKIWELDTLKPKGTLLTEPDTEFWTVRFSEGVLYSGDNTGNVRFHKNDKLYGSINVAEPVKALSIFGNLLFTSKDNDVVVTDLQLTGDKPQFGVKATLPGRGPLTILNQNVFFISRNGKDIITNIIDPAHHQHIKEVSKVTNAHEMIINGTVAVEWNGSSFLFSGGWDKVVKQWKIEKDGLKPVSVCNADIVVNSLISGEKGQLYAGGADGHIIRIDI